MILKIINLFTSNLTKSFLTFTSLTLAFSIFAQDIPPYILNKHYTALECDIDYENNDANLLESPDINHENNGANLLEPPDINHENNGANLLESPDINHENNGDSLSVSSAIDYENVELYGSDSSSIGGFIFGGEGDDQIEYPVFEDNLPALLQDDPFVDSEEESGYFSDDSNRSSNSAGEFIFGFEGDDQRRLSDDELF